MLYKTKGSDIKVEWILYFSLRCCKEFNQPLLSSLGIENITDY